MAQAERDSHLPSEILKVESRYALADFLATQRNLGLCWLAKKCPGVRPGFLGLSGADLCEVGGECLP